MSGVRGVGRATDGGEAAALALAADPRFRVLRRIEPMRRMPSRGVADDMLKGCAVDVETTGLNLRNDEIIELALQRFWADPTGRIVGTGRRHSWLEEPVAAPITEEITRITGISREDVRGRSIMDAEAESLLGDADFIVAHNAAFDRPFIERRLPWVQNRRWVCTLNDVVWRDHGFEGRVLGHLLMQMGWFYSAHRAQTDVDALLHLLDHPLNGEGTVLRAAVNKASRPTWRITAADAPFSAKNVLCLRGYRWDADMRVWWTEIAEDRLDEELGWSVGEVYGGRGRPRYAQVTWNSRYAESRPS